MSFKEIIDKVDSIYTFAKMMGSKLNIFCYNEIEHSFYFYCEKIKFEVICCDLRHSCTLTLEVKNMGGARAQIFDIGEIIYYQRSNKIDK